MIVRFGALRRLTLLIAASGAMLGCSIDTPRSEPLAGAMVGRHVAHDGEGNFVLAGVGSEMNFVTKLDAAGHVLWRDQFGGSSGHARVRGLAVHPEGDVVIVGEYSGAVSFGGAPLEQADMAGFAAKLDAAGRHVWSQRLPGMMAFGVAIDLDGRIFLNGLSTTEAAADGKTFATAQTRLFILALDPAGHALWTRDGATESVFPTLTEQGIAVDHDGNVAFAGWRFKGADFGGGPLHGPAVIKLSPTGEHLWSRALSHGAFPSVAAFPALAFAHGGDLVVAGSFLGGQIDLGGGPKDPGRGLAGFVARYAPTGEHLWSASYAGDVSLRPNGVATTIEDHTVVVGSLGGTVDFGGGPLTAERDNVFVATFDADGHHASSRRYGAACEQSADDVVAYGTEVAVTGSFRCAIDFGDGPMRSNEPRGFLTVLPVP
jgi:outer membrane protein assembly factor BamB